MRKTFTRGQRVTVATIGGPQDAIVERPEPTAAGNIMVRRIYPSGVQGAPRIAHVDDVKAAQ